MDIIDEVAMQSMMKSIEPMLSQGSAWSQTDNDIGFAVSMDFYPSEEMGESAVYALLGKYRGRALGGNMIH